MKAFFYDWNSPPSKDGICTAYRASEDWPVPEIGESVTVGSEDIFCPAVVIAFKADHRGGADRLIVVRVDTSERLPIPLGWPTDDLTAGVVRSIKYERVLRLIAGQQVEPGTTASVNASYMPWQMKVAREALSG